MKPISFSLVVSIILISYGISILVVNLNHILNLPVLGTVKDFNDHLGPNKAVPFYYLLIFTIISPVCEEVVFRGVLLRECLTNFSKPVSIIISALLFDILHANSFQIVGGIAISFFFCYIYVKTHNLAYAIIAHASYNSVCFVLTNLLGIRLENYLYTLNIFNTKVQLLKLDILAILFIFVGIRMLKSIKDKEGFCYDK